MIKMKNHNNINIIRGFGVLGVLAIHATGPIVNPKLNEASIWINLIIIINQLSRFCVPLFFFISAYLYGNKYREREVDYIRYIYNRIKIIYIPFIFWSIAYTLLQLITREISLEQCSFDKIFMIVVTGSSSGHLYFVPAIFQFYLILPILLWISKLVNKLELDVFFIITLFFFMGIVYYFRLLYVFDGPVGQIYTKTFWFYWWCPYFALGLQIGIASKSTFKLNKIFLSFSIFAAMTVMCVEYINIYKSAASIYAEQHLVYNAEQAATFLRPTAFIYAASVLLYMVYFANYDFFVKISFIKNIGIYSFGIYLLHPIINKVIIKIIKIIGFDITHSVVSFPIIFFIGLAGTYFMVRWCDKFTISRYIMGNFRINEK
jgi:surface polysaccharide O-acyltransferase-like enzyme